MRQWSGTTSSGRVSGSCSTACWTRNCLATPKHSSASGSDLPRPGGPAARRAAGTGGRRDARRRPAGVGIGEAASTAFGEDAYPSIHAKAAALLHSIARNRPLVDGNKRLALAATIAFYGLNGVRPTMSDDEACGLVMAVAVGKLDDVEGIAGRLESSTAPWS